MTLTDELSDVELAPPAHLRCPGVANVRVVLPDRDRRVLLMVAQVIEQRVGRVRHVAVAKVPRRDVGAVHLLVVLLRIPDHDRVLLGEEGFVERVHAIAAEVVGGTARRATSWVTTSSSHGIAPCVRERVAVRLALRAPESIEACVACAGACGFLGVDGFEVRDDGFHRRGQAVEVQPVEADLVGRVASIVVVPQPLDEPDDLAVAPHPGREPAEAPERVLGVRVRRLADDVPVDAIRVGPVALDRDGGQPVVARSVGG